MSPVTDGPDLNYNHLNETGIIDPGDLNISLMDNVSEGSNYTRCEPEGTCYFFTADTRYGNIQLVTPLLGIVWPLLTLVTLTSNTLIILVLTRFLGQQSTIIQAKQLYNQVLKMPLMRTPTNLVLLAMAVCDLLTITSPAPWYVYLFTIGNHLSMEWTGSLCYIFDFMVETTPQMFHSSSNLLTLALAVQRYIYVCHATTAKQWCTLARSKMVIILILILSIGHIIPRTFDRTYSTILNEDVNSSSVQTVCKVQFSPWLISDPNTLNIYFNTFFWFRVLFVQLIPCISLVILNILLFAAMRKAESRRRRLTVNRTVTQVKPSNGRRSSIFGLSKENRRQRDANSTTMMLIVVIAVFLVVEVPLAVMSALHTISSSVYEFMNYVLAKDIVMFIDMMICMSYPVNFAIYCGMSRQFRSTFNSLILAPCVKFFNLKPKQNGSTDILHQPVKKRGSTEVVVRQPNLKNGNGVTTDQCCTSEQNGLLTTEF